MRSTCVETATRWAGWMDRSDEGRYTEYESAHGHTEAPSRVVLFAEKRPDGGPKHREAVLKREPPRPSSGRNISAPRWPQTPHLNHRALARRRRLTYKHT